MAEPLFRVQGLSLSFGNQPMLRAIDLQIASGTVLAVAGPNGSGKSTLLKACAGLLGGTQGQLHVGDSDPRSLPPAARARAVTYAGSELKLEFALSASEVVALSGTDPEPAMKRALCWHLRDRDIRELSGGERQLVLLARTLALGARVIFLDETLSRMDLNHQALVGTLIRELAREGRAIALVAHDLNLAASCAERMLLLREGRVHFEGPVREALTEAHLAALYPGGKLRVGAHPGSGAPQVYLG